MFQNRTEKFRHVLLGGTASLLLAGVLGTSAMAATAPIQTERASVRSVSLPLERVGMQTSDLTLDWRTPEAELFFDLPPSDLVEALTLRLLGDPLSGGTKATRIELVVNDAEPVPLQLDARGFTATLPLDTRELRARRNMLRLRLVSPDGSSCLTEADGGWDLDLTRSRITASARARSRAVFLSEVETLLSQATENPRILSILTYGDDARTHEAIAAQGLALRTPSIPTFVLGRQVGDLSVVIGTRKALAGVVTDQAILDGKGARTAIHEGRPLRIVLTGDTTEEVRDAVDAFATHSLPRANRRFTSPEEMRILRPLDHDRRVAEGRVRLHELGGLGFSDNWGAGPDAVTFSVADPQAAMARVKLNFERKDFISPESRVAISLNGRDLGSTVLDTDKVGVDVRVPQGWLKGHNTLTVTPDLKPAEGGCAPRASLAGLNVTSRSFVEVETSTSSSDADLSRLAAGNGVFADDNGEGTHIALPARRSEREAALRMLARVAKAHGAGLVEASYGSEDRPDADLMAFGPLPSEIETPRVFDDIRRDTARGVGIAAFPDNARWVAHFAPLRASSMASAAETLSGPAWDDLSGAVSRVRGADAELVKTAYPLNTTPIEPGFSFPNFDLAELPPLEEIGDEMRASFDSSVATLEDSWSRVEIVDMNALEARLRAPFARIRLRGRFDPPRATRAGLDTQPVRIAAGFNFKRWERNAEQKAAQMRKSTGIPKAKMLSWKWGDRNMSIAAMLVMLAFGFSCWFLSTSAPVSTWRR